MQKQTKLYRANTPYVLRLLHPATEKYCPKCGYLLAEVIKRECADTFIDTVTAQVCFKCEWSADDLSKFIKLDVTIALKKRGEPSQSAEVMALCRNPGRMNVGALAFLKKVADGLDELHDRGKN